MDIFIACIQNDIKKIKYLIKKNKNFIYLSDNDGNTIGHLCAIYKFYDLLIKILNIYPKLITFINNKGKSIIHLVDDYDTLSKIIDIALYNEYFDELNIIQYDGKSLLINLLDKLQDFRYLKIIKKLLDVDIRLDIPVDSPPLSYYMDNNPNHEVTSLLLEAGADPNQKDKNGKNPLIIAILNNVDINIIKLLLDYNADINYAGPEDKYLPLNIALNNNIIIHELIKYNPDLTKQDKNMNSPLHIVLQNNLDLQDDIIRYIITNSNLNIQNIDGQTPLHLLIISKNIDKYQDLIKNKDLNFCIKDNNNRTPISYMNTYNYINMINKLSNKILTNICENNNTKIDFKSIEPFRSSIKNKLIKNNYKIKIPNVVKTNYGIFGANIFYNVIYLIQFLKKYNDAFIPFQYFIPEKCINSIIKIQDENLFRTNYGKSLHNIIEMYTEYFYELTPSIIIWHSKDINYYDKNLYIYIKKLLDANIRFIIMKLTIITSKNLNHANIIIYDKKNNIIERFEPFGPVNYFIKDIDLLDKYLYNIFKDYFKNLKYKTPHDYMEKTKFQLISNESDLKNKKMGDPDGFCLAWCYWFLELKLENPDVDTEDLITNALSNIINQNNTDQNSILNYIRNYGKKLDLLKNEFLLSIGFKDDELYNIAYNSNKFNLLFDCISNVFNRMVKERITYN